MIKKIIILFLNSSLSIFAVGETEKIANNIVLLTKHFPNPALLDLLSHYTSLLNNANPEVLSNSSYIKENQACIEMMMQPQQPSLKIDILKILLTQYEQQAKKRYVFLNHTTSEKL